VNHVGDDPRQAPDRDDVAEKQDSTAADVGGLADLADLEGSKHEVQNDCRKPHAASTSSARVLANARGGSSTHGVTTSTRGTA